LTLPKRGARPLSEETAVVADGRVGDVPPVRPETREPAVPS
jgi:hypothetical protein